MLGVMTALRSGSLLFGLGMWATPLGSEIHDRLGVRWGAEEVQTSCRTGGKGVGAPWRYGRGLSGRATRTAVVDVHGEEVSGPRRDAVDSCKLGQDGV